MRLQPSISPKKALSGNDLVPIFGGSLGAPHAALIQLFHVFRKAFSLVYPGPLTLWQTFQRWRLLPPSSMGAQLCSHPGLMGRYLSERQQLMAHPCQYKPLLVLSPSQQLHTPTMKAHWLKVALLVQDRQPRHPQSSWCQLPWACLGRGHLQHNSQQEAVLQRLRRPLLAWMLQRWEGLHQRDRSDLANQRGCVNLLSNALFGFTAKLMPTPR